MVAVGWRAAILCGLVTMSLAAASAHGQSFASIDAAVKDGIQKGIYPGAVVIIGRRDSLLYARGLRPLHLEPVVAGAAARLDPLGHRLDHEGREHRHLGAPAGGSRQARPRRAGAPVSAAILRRPQEPGHRAHAARPHERPQELRALLPEGAREPRRAPIDLLYAQPLVRVPGDSAGVQRSQRALPRSGSREGVRAAARPARAARGVRPPRHDADDVPAAAPRSSGGSSRAGCGGAGPSRAT